MILSFYDGFMALARPYRRVFNGMCINLLTRAEIVFRKITVYSVFLTPRANDLQEANPDPSPQTLRPRPRQPRWLARGDLDLNGHDLHAGDGARVSAESSLSLHTTGTAEFLLFT